MMTLNISSSSHLANQMELIMAMSKQVGQRPDFVESALDVFCFFVFDGYSEAHRLLT
jgi:hypothetical protein